MAHKERAEYGKQVIFKLSGDLGISDTVLHRTYRFVRQFPILARGPKLTWSHYRALIPIEEDEKRFDLERRAARLGWTTPELIEKIKKESRENGTGPLAPSSKKEISSFQPKRGVLHTYQVLHLGHVGLKGEHPGSGETLSIDLGFSTFMGLPGGIAKHFEEDDIVEAVAGRAVPLLKALPKATEAGLYTYRAELARVIDADTHWMRIDLGLFNLKLRQKLRLRGIDAPELSTQAGQKAKRFVEQQFKKASEIIITTTKPDKYDRYLSDVWLGGVNLNKLLLEKGLARTRTDFSEDDWTDLNWGRF